MEVRQMLQQALDCGASDIFIIAGLPLTYKVNGRQRRCGERLMPADTEAALRAIYALAGRDDARLRQSDADDDFSFAIPQMGRFRANVLHQRGTLAAVLRVIRFGLPDPAALGIPPQVLDIARARKGLVLVTGPAGNGKSTTLACLIDRINREREAHIITMEDPIEYIHRHDRSIVTQREIGSDSPSYVSALRSALRESPDVILLGEMRDLETTEVAMTAAETGQLLFSTLHTTGAANTVDRIVDVFPAGQQAQVRIQLSMVLQAVVSQQLVPTLDGGQTAVFEVMKSNTAIRNLIREAKTHQLDAAIQAGRGRRHVHDGRQPVPPVCGRAHQPGYRPDLLPALRLDPPQARSAGTAVKTCRKGGNFRVGTTAKSRPKHRAHRAHAGPLAAHGGRDRWAVRGGGHRFPSRGR